MTGAWVRKELRGMRDSPRPKAGHERVCGGASSDGGGSARRGTPAQAVRGSPVFRKGRKRPMDRAQCMGNTKGGSCGAVCHCSMLATARLRCEQRWSDGERRSGLGKGLRPLQLVQKVGRVRLVLT